MIRARVASVCARAPGIATPTLHVVFAGFAVFVATASGFLLTGLWPNLEARLHANMVLFLALAVAYAGWLVLVGLRRVPRSSGLGFVVSGYALTVRAVAELDAPFAFGAPPEHHVWDVLAACRGLGLAGMVAGLALVAGAIAFDRRIAHASPPA